MGSTPDSVRLVQCATQSNTKPLRRAVRRVQTVGMSEPQLLAAHSTPTPMKLFVCKFLLLSVMKVTNQMSVSAGQFKKTHSLTPAMKGCGDRLSWHPSSCFTGSTCRSEQECKKKLNKIPFYLEVVSVWDDFSFKFSSV